MTDEPRWLSKQIVMALQSEAVVRFGGAASVRDEGLLESALQHPLSLFPYGEATSLHQLAAVFGAAIIRNHPFIDGNNRVGVLTICAFLFRNGAAFELAPLPRRNPAVRRRALDRGRLWAYGRCPLS